MDRKPGFAAVERAADQLGIDLAALVAATGYWVEPQVQSAYVSQRNPSGAVYPDVRRARRASKMTGGKLEDGTRLDQNNYAGTALRRALGLPQAEINGYEACHVWPDSCYDARYHTALANLVLVPAPLASLTDHEPRVVACLQFRAFELYGWHPVECVAPLRPDRYPANWLAPRGGEPARRSRGKASQVQIVRELWLKHGGDAGAVVQAWVEAVRAGTAIRARNARGISEEAYGRRLISHYRRKGVLT